MLALKFDRKKYDRNLKEEGREEGREERWYWNVKASYLSS